MPLTQLILSNFQAHSYTVIKFDEGVTTVVGPSDVGKSAVIRALRWVCLNDIPGLSFRKEGTKEVSVTLEVDGHSITRTRTSSSNKYVMDGQDYSSFGNDVPEPIKQVLATSGLNFQSQHDAPFWLSLPTGEVAKRLNQLVDLEVIDRSTANINTEHRRALARVRECEETAERLDDELVGLQWVDQCNDAVKACTVVGEVIKGYRTDSEKLSHITEELTAQTTKIREGTQQLAQIDAFLSAADLLTTKQKAADRLTELLKTIAESKALVEFYHALTVCLGVATRLEYAQTDLNKLNDLIDRIQKASTAAKQDIPDVSELQRVGAALKDAKQRAVSLSGLVDKLKRIDQQIKDGEQRLAEVQRDIAAVETCPTCGRPM